MQLQSHIRMKANQEKEHEFNPTLGILFPAACRE